MKYTGLNPNDINRIASGSLPVSVDNTRVTTFGTDSFTVSGSSTLSGSLNVEGSTAINGAT